MLIADPTPAAGPWIGLGLFLVLFPILTSLSNRLMGIPALYAAFPADPEDAIEENLGWQQVRFAGLRGHTPMSVRFGRRCLHLKQPFPFQPAWWRGPASIPWDQIRVEKEVPQGRWAFLGGAVFRLSSDGPAIRMGGKAALRLQDRVKRAQEARGFQPPPPALRPS